MFIMKISKQQFVCKFVTERGGDRGTKEEEIRLDLGLDAFHKVYFGRREKRFK